MENMNSIAAIPVIVYGAGGLGREVMQIVLKTLTTANGEYAALGYVDDGVAPGTILNGFPVLGGGDYLENLDRDIALMLGIAAPDVKAGLYRKFKEKRGISFPNVIHPGASVSGHARLGRGVVAMFGSYISIDAVLGDFVFINNGASIGHDSIIGAFTSIMPLAAISGNVTVGERCLIGVQCSVKQGLSIGNDATVGMGSVVLSDVPDGVTVVGNPARTIG